MIGTHAIKVRNPGERAWYFLTPSGGETRLWMHAGSASLDVAQRVAADLMVREPGLSAKVVPHRYSAVR